MGAAKKRNSSRPIQLNEDFLDDFIPYILFRLSNRLDQMLRENLRELGISQARWRVMALLRALEPSNISQIVELTFMEQPTISRVVQQLERDGLASRSISETDQRAAYISLTTKGRSFFDEIYPKAALHQQKALSGFTAKETDELKNLLGRIGRNIGVNAHDGE